MNSVRDPINAALPSLPLKLQLDTALLQTARALAAMSQRPLITELQALTGHDARELVHAVAQPFALDVIETIVMLALLPAFDVLALSRAMQKHCVILRMPVSAELPETATEAKIIQPQLIAVIADPFDIDLQTRLDTTAKHMLHYKLALRSDIQAYLSKQEESARAVDPLQHRRWHATAR